MWALRTEIRKSNCRTKKMEMKHREVLLSMAYKGKESPTSPDSPNNPRTMVAWKLTHANHSIEMENLMGTLQNANMKILEMTEAAVGAKGPQRKNAIIIMSKICWRLLGLLPMRCAVVSWKKEAFFAGRMKKMEDIRNRTESYILNAVYKTWGFKKLARAVSIWGRQTEKRKSIKRQESAMRVFAAMKKIERVESLNTVQQKNLELEAELRAWSDRFMKISDAYRSSPKLDFKVSMDRISAVDAESKSAADVHVVDEKRPGRVIAWDQVLDNDLIRGDGTGDKSRIGGYSRGYI